MTILVIDCESTIHEKGNPFSRSNKLCCVGTYDGAVYTYYDIEHSLRPYGETLNRLAQQIERAGLLVGHNTKFDLNWIRRYIPNLKVNRVWDTQLFEYMDSKQTWTMPSLEDCATKWSLPAKGDLATEYWDKGIDTTGIPANTLLDYNRQDCLTTHSLYVIQKERLKPEQASLFYLHCDDLLVLQEMEFNGIMLDLKKNEEERKKTEVEYKQVLTDLQEFDPHGIVNWNSDDHLSVVLYGGTIAYRAREVVTKTYKKGPKQVERWGTANQEYPRLVEPIDGTARAKEGLFFVNEDVIRTLRPKDERGKRLLGLLRRSSDLNKLLTTYYVGLPKLAERMDWEPGVLHGSFNQSVTKTGRSSCSKPNQQNFDGRIKELFVSRYAD